jgi:hypothetical protein
MLREEGSGLGRKNNFDMIIWYVDCLAYVRHVKIARAASVGLV